jgi:superfamily II DNA or RNA helicase
MDSPSEANDRENSASNSNEGHFLLRSYQAEMVEESLRGNVIVVMDTGSGKTHM